MSPHPCNLPPSTTTTTNSMPDGNSSQLNTSGALPDDFKDQDRTLPIANVARIMKQAVPESAKISKEAKETMQLAVSEFIAFVTSEAKDRCYQERRKTVTGEDLIVAMDSLGFENYALILRHYLAKYKEVVSSEAGSNHRG